MLFHGEMARYILKRGLFLCVLLLAVTVALVLRAKGGGPLAPRFYEYAAAFHFCWAVRWRRIFGGAAGDKRRRV